MICKTKVTISRITTFIPIHKPNEHPEGSIQLAWPLPQPKLDPEVVFIVSTFPARKRQFWSTNLKRLEWQHCIHSPIDILLSVHKLDIMASWWTTLWHNTLHKMGHPCEIGLENIEWLHKVQSITIKYALTAFALK